LKKINLFIVLASVVFLNPSCVKDTSCSPNPVANEASQIQAYALAEGIATTTHPSGLFYEILDPGAGATPNVNSNITITYRGELLSGEMFDERTTPNDPAWPLFNLIEGWIIGIPLIKKGGHIKLIVPSALAYGCQGRGVIPPNAPLYFDIHLVDVQ
jgi:FKBP-type peptidyl-prolyl cis-trans isomerase FkpA